MFGYNDSIDTERLRKDMKDEALGAYFGAGIGGALVEHSDIQNASDDELVKMAKTAGYDLKKYMD